MDLVQMLLGNKEFNSKVEAEAQVAFLKMFGAYQRIRVFSGFTGVEERANRKTPQLSLEALADRLVEYGLAKKESALQQARNIVGELQFKRDDIRYRFVMITDAKSGVGTYRLEGKDETPDYGW